jgi:YHS domain-containing protein
VAIEPVCGMQVDEQQPAGKSDYQAKTYYFCSLECKRRFDQNPERYLDEVSANTVDEKEDIIGDQSPRAEHLHREGICSCQDIKMSAEEVFPARGVSSLWGGRNAVAREEIPHRLA